MKASHIFFSTALVTGLLISCEPTIEPPVDMGYNYFPIDTGRYYIYDVDSIFIDCPTYNDTTHYQVKEYYESTFIDASNNPAIRIERYYRSDSTQSWLTMTPDVWFLNRNTTRLEKVEENLRFVKMTYPVDMDYSWNGNAYNVLPAQDYYYQGQDVALNNGIYQFDSTLTVVQYQDTNQIQYYYFTETYARNVGMVRKQEYDIETLMVDTNACGPWPYTGLQWYQVPKLLRIQKGTIVNYKIIDYGFE